MNDGYKDKIAKWLTFALVMTILVVGLIMIWPTYLRTQELKRKDAELAEKIDAKKREIARLCEYQQRFKTDRDFVETIARQNRRVFPGELVFIFEDE